MILLTPRKSELFYIMTFNLQETAKEVLKRNIHREETAGKGLDEYLQHTKFSSSVSLPGPAESHWAALHCAQLKTWNSTPWQSKEGWESLSEPAQEVEYWPNLITGHLLPFSPLLLAHCDIQAISHRTQQSAAACTPLPRASPYTPQHAAVIAFPISPQRQQLPWQPAMILISLVCFQGQHTRAGTWARCRHAPGGRRTYHQIQRVENTLGSEKP